MKRLSRSILTIVCLCATVAFAEIDGRNGAEKTEMVS